MAAFGQQLRLLAARIYRRAIEATHKTKGPCLLQEGSLAQANSQFAHNATVGEVAAHGGKYEAGARQIMQVSQQRSSSQLQVGRTPVTHAQRPQTHISITRGSPPLLHLTWAQLQGLPAHNTAQRVALPVHNFESFARMTAASFIGTS